MRPKDWLTKTILRNEDEVLNIRLADYGARVEAGVLILGGDDNPRVVFRVARRDADLRSPIPPSLQPLVAIQRNGVDMSSEDVVRQIRLDGPVAYWLRYFTNIDVDRAVFGWKVSPPELDGCAQQARSLSLLPIDQGFDLHLHPDIQIKIPLDINQVIYEHGEVEHIVFGGPGEIQEALESAGYDVLFDSDESSPVSVRQPTPR